MKKAFSLIELLISLIIISLLLGAFAPIITKKLKATDITVGSFSSNNQNTELKNNAPQSQKDCDKFNALFIPASMNGGKNICITKYNMGDNGLPLTAAQILSVNQTCTNKGNCCWKGTTSPTCGLSGNSGADYSGCSRTVCQWAAANASCASYAPNGTKAGGWRLPTNSEFSVWAQYATLLNNNKGKDGLQLCVNPETAGDASGYVACSIGRNLCTGSADNHCYPYTLWSQTPYPNSNEIKYYTVVNTLKLSDLEQKLTASVRCVYDGLNDYDIAQKPSEKDPEPEQSPKTCNPETVTLAGTDTKVTKFNMGDDSACSRDIIEGMSGVTFVPVGTNCTNELCCWYGVTAIGSTCTNVGGVYSGCNRTVCKWQAAKKICESMGDGWKLPDTSNSMATWYPNNSTASTGLMLCDQTTTGTSASKCVHVVSCLGAYGNTCFPYDVWAHSENGKNAQSSGLGDRTWRGFAYDKSGAFSVRCVKE